MGRVGPFFHFLMGSVGFGLICRKYVLIHRINNRQHVAAELRFSDSSKRRYIASEQVHFWTFWKPEMYSFCCVAFLLCTEERCPLVRFTCVDWVWSIYFTFDGLVELIESKNMDP